VCPLRQVSARPGRGRPWSSETLAPCKRAGILDEALGSSALLEGRADGPPDGHRVLEEIAARDVEVVAHLFEAPLNAVELVDRGVLAQVGAVVFGIVFGFVFSLFIPLIGIGTSHSPRGDRSARTCDPLGRTSTPCHRQSLEKWYCSSMVSAGSYEPRALLARGGQCEIWLGVLVGAEDFRRPVVLKRAYARADRSLERSRASLITEAKVAAALSHPNVIHVYQLIDTPEGLMLAMEYLHGLSLRRVLATTARDEIAAVSWPLACRICADAARGLAYAYLATSPTGEDLQVVHQDVSPENLVVTDLGVTKVVDFGIARSSLSELSQESIVQGKLAYMSPEQLRGESLDPSTDVFSLGAVLHEALTGRRLFKRSTQKETTDAVLHGPIEDLDSSISLVVRDLVRQMLVRNSGARNVTMAQCADVLESACTAQGGTYANVATALRATHGEALDIRRRHVEELLARPVLGGPPHTESQSSAMMILEEVLGTPPPLESDEGAHSQRGRQEAPREKDLTDTMVEHPLPRRS